MRENVVQFAHIKDTIYSSNVVGRLAPREIEHITFANDDVSVATIHGMNTKILPRKEARTFRVP
jgi:hypothetical protein